MCGIFGAIGKEYNRDKITFLAVLNESRGKHSTGIYNGKSIAKGVLPATDFVTYNRNIIDKPNNRYILGHTRHATNGGRTYENTHPFRIGNIVGSHNGIIMNDIELGKELEVDYDVDSQYIFHLLNSENGINNALKKLVGWFAIWWVNLEKPDKIYLARHSAPLSYVVDNGVLYFSSDDEHLKAVFSYKADIKDIKNDTLVIIDVDTLDVKTRKLKNLQSYTYTGYCRPVTVTYKDEEARRLQNYNLNWEGYDETDDYLDHIIDANADYPKEDNDDEVDNSLDESEFEFVDEEESSAPTCDNCGELLTFHELANFEVDGEYILCRLCYMDLQEGLLEGIGVDLETGVCVVETEIDKE